MIITEQSPKRYCNTKAISRINSKCICLLFLRLLEVRGRYYELLTHCIPPDIIFKVTKRERERERERGGGEGERGGGRERGRERGREVGRES